MSGEQIQKIVAVGETRPVGYGLAQRLPIVELA